MLIADFVGKTDWYTQTNPFRVEDMVSSQLNGAGVQRGKEGFGKCQFRHDGQGIRLIKR